MSNFKFEYLARKKLKIQQKKNIIDKKLSFHNFRKILK